MFARINRAAGLATIVVLTVTSLGACSSSDNPATTAAAETTTTSSAVADAATASSVTTTVAVGGTDGEAAAAVPTDGALTAQELDALLMMREEEKLAHDVYVTLGDEWGLRIFENIAKSETTHTEAVASLIDRYGIEDPAIGKDIGEFANPDFTLLYEQLVEEGSKSLVSALGVGAFIEDLDIFDLEELLDVVENHDIARVFESLLKGSRNHMRAFTSQLESRGETYEPSYLTQEDYEAIINAPRERGRA